MHIGHSASRPSRTLDDSGRTSRWPFMPRNAPGTGDLKSQADVPRLSPAAPDYVGVAYEDRLPGPKHLGVSLGMKPWIAAGPSPDRSDFLIRVERRECPGDHTLLPESTKCAPALVSSPWHLPFLGVRFPIVGKNRLAATLSPPNRGAEGRSQLVTKRSAQMRWSEGDARIAVFQGPNLDRGIAASRS